MKRTLETRGAVVSTQDVERLFRLSIEGKERGLKRIREGGLRASQRDVLVFLNRQIVRSRSSQTVAYRRVALQGVPQAECDAMQLVIDATGLAATLNAAGCFTGLCLPCCAAGLILALLASVLKLEKDAACSGLTQ